jgi:hypothetical protein
LFVSSVRLLLLENFKIIPLSYDALGRKLASRNYNLGKMKVFEIDSHSGTLYLYADFSAEDNLPVDLSIVPVQSKLLAPKSSCSKSDVRFKLAGVFYRIALATTLVVVLGGVGVDLLSAVILATSMIGALLTFSAFGYGDRLIISKLADPKVVSAELLLWGLSGGALGIFLSCFLLHWIERARAVVTKKFINISKSSYPSPFSPFLAALLVLFQWWLWGMFLLRVFHITQI